MASTATEEQGTSGQLESPTSRFTAVNGKEPPVAGPANSTGVSRRGSDERSNGQPRISPPGQEKLTITTTTTSQREDWLPPSNGDRLSYQPPNPYSDPDASHKRKRSGSIEHNSSSANSYHTHALPSSTKQTPTTATTATTESDTPRDDAMRPQSSIEQRDPYAESQYRQFMASQEEHRGHGNDSWHARQYPPPHLTSDEQLGEALQRASQNMDAQRGYGSPDDDRSANPYGYGNREMSAQSDPKKRKRNFSNRTKTGCMTCRRRKKKCDESRPECNNCLRGGFVCSGYQQRGQWPKTEQKAAPIPLQSKTEYENSPYSSSSPYAPHLSQPRREPLPGYRGQNLRVDPQHGRHIGMDDEQPSASTIPSASVASPENNRLSAISYNQQIPTPVTASSSAYPDRQPKNAYDRVGPLHDLSRQDPRADSDTGTPQSASSTLPQILHPQMHANSPHSSNPQVTAQLALSNLTPTSRPRTQKEQMLAGQHYFPFDKELVLERERCNGACWRFNSSTNPNNGVSPEERARLFRDILQPREQVISPTQASPITPVGRVGDNVVVEAPFNCDYGYNISIGQDVAIGKNCTILDTCEVEIGDRCHIGPNVNIYTATLPIDPKRRLGSRGPNYGRKIVIEADVWIGGGVTILPGRTIGKGSTVGAGSVVTRDVPSYTVVCGNPARVMRGIYVS
ncbi:related to acetyltransferase (nodulation protein nodL) [Phialocephala subalpina]|uniref:Related to acetyltransferase (Nodulation protein nodL) n=1 Tax=Phialocephala subalpina TaxID=576137 RepID=A0A1L7X5V8_9HELO|nr:related to acetyltransferase (nodulation protein nodL) [Phialocephala subalpina]